MAGTAAQAMAHVQANLRVYAGVVTRETVDHGAWLLKVGHSMFKPQTGDDGWVTHVHQAHDGCVDTAWP